MVVEIAFALAFLAGGAALLQAFGLRGWGTIPLGFLTGVAMFLGCGVLIVVAPIPANPLFGLVLVVAVPGFLWLRRRRSAPELRLRLAPVLLSTGTVAIVTGLARGLHLDKWHADSLEYLNSQALITQGKYDVAASGYLLVKRLIGVPWLHSPGVLNGEYIFHAVTPLIALAVLGSIAWFATQLRATATPRPSMWWAVALGVALLATSNRFVFHAFYLNGHLLVGALILIACGAAWLILADPHDDSARPAYVALIAVAAAASVAIRPESSLLMAMALVPFFTSTAVPLRSRLLVWAALTMMTVVWNAYVADHLLAQGSGVLAVLPQLAVVVAIGVALAMSSWSRSQPLVPRLVGIVEWGAWPAVVALLVVFPAIAVASGRAFVINAYGNGGFWGASYWVYSVLAVVAVVAFSFRAEGALRFYVVTFLPVAIALGVVRGSAYRVGPMDSLSRMLMQQLPALAFYITVAIAHGEPRTWLAERLDRPRGKQASATSRAPRSRPIPD